MLDAIAKAWGPHDRNVTLAGLVLSVSDYAGADAVADECDEANDIDPELLADLESDAPSKPSIVRITTPLPAHVAVQSFSPQGMSLVVHQRLGADHRRNNQGCEDVFYHECPFAGFSNAGLFCIFDGHHGVNAANRAKQLLPGALKLKVEVGGWVGM